MRTGFRAYFFNTSWLMAERILRLMATIVVGIWLARYLGPSLFGEYSFALALLGLCAPVLQLGLRPIMVRELVRQPYRAPELLGSSLVLRILAALIASAVAGSLVALGGTTGRTSGYLFILMLGQIAVSSEVFAYYFDAQVRSRRTAIAGVAQLTTSILLKGALILLEAPLFAFFVANAVENLVLALVLILFASRRGMPLHRLRFGGRDAKDLLRNSWPLILSGIAVIIYMRTDLVMIRAMLGVEAAGHYAVAVRLSESWYFVPMVIAQSLYPAVIQARTQGPAAYDRVLARLTGGLFWLGVVAAAVILASGPFAVRLLFGVSYSPASIPLSILAMAGIFVSLGIANTQWFNAENLQHWATLSTALGAIANIILNLILIPLAGIAGGAFATLVAYGIAGYAALVLFPTTRPRFTKLNRALLFPWSGPRSEASP